MTSSIKSRLPIFFKYSDTGIFQYFKFRNEMNNNNTVNDILTAIFQTDYNIEVDIIECITRLHLKPRRIYHSRCAVVFRFGAIMDLVHFSEGIPSAMYCGYFLLVKMLFCRHYPILIGLRFLCVSRNVWLHVSQTGYITRQGSD